jgi:hypothetical protein
MNYLIIALAVLAATVANMLIGMLWYSPFFLGSLWKKLANYQPQQSEGKQAAKVQLAMTGSTLCAVVMASIMACFMHRMHITSIVSSFHFGWMSWLGFVATVTLHGVLFTDSSFVLYLLHNGYNLLSMVVMALILGIGLRFGA